MATIRSSIGHIVIPVDDMERALRFYRDALGFKVRGKVDPVWTVVDSNGTELTIFLNPRSPRVALGKDGVDSPFHLHVNDFRRAATTLEGSGIRVKRLDDRQGLVWDPAGNLFGLHDHRATVRTRKTASPRPVRRARAKTVKPQAVKSGNTPAEPNRTLCIRSADRAKPQPN